MKTSWLPLLWFHGIYFVLYLSSVILQVIGRAKLQRLAALAKLAKVSVCVDDVENIRDISTVAQEAGVTIDCVVEVNVGQDR